ncbi:hypothetical protein RQP46_002730 [Phenoliferia psychrophenolica]
MSTVKGGDWDEPHQARYDALRASSLVCTRWRDPAQRTLFDDVMIPNVLKRRSAAFLASQARSRHPTRSLWGYVDRPVKGIDIWSVAKGCRGLRWVSLQGEEIGNSWGKLASPCFADVKHLIINSSSHSSNNQPRSALSMRLLSLELHWYGDGDNNTSTSMIHSLLKSSKETLHTLHVHLLNEATERDLSAVVPLVASRLRTLVIAARWKDQHPISMDFTTLSSLEDIPLLRLPSHHEGISEVRLGGILDAIPSLPPTLLRLSIGINSRTRLDKFLPLLHHPALSGLQRLDFQFI